MNIMEETQGEYRIKITGLSIRQIKDIFENEYGALMWSGGGAYPCDGVTLQFKSTDGPAAMPVGELTDEQDMRDAQEAPFEAWWESMGQYGRAGGGGYEKTFAWNAWCAAARSHPTTEESSVVAGAQPVREPLKGDSNAVP